MNVEIATVAMQIIFWEYLVRILGIGSLQCSFMDRKKISYSSEVLRDFLAGKFKFCGTMGEKKLALYFL
jgi:hypothetical protein